jgi:hypothetical protein
MIYEELKNLLSLARADNTAETFDMAVSLFETMGQDDYMGIFEATISSSPGLTDEELVEELVNDLHVLINNIFTIQGVALIDEVLLSDKVKLARGLIDIFDYSDRTALMRIVETDLNPEEKLAELFSLVTEYETETAFSFIEEVNPAVPERIKEFIVEEVMEESYNEVMKTIVELYIKFKERLMNNEPFYLDKHVSAVDTIGMEYKTYLTDLLKHQAFIDLLAKLDTMGKIGDEAIYEQISKYLIGIACLSADGFTKPIETIRTHMDQITNNINALGKLETRLSKNLIKLTSAGAVNE